LVPIHENLIDLAWGKDRPESPKDKVFVQPVKYSGREIK
jgi:Xaa-Pro aminopeptidase